MPSAHDTIAALATPVGTAALAIVRITGPDTMRLVGEIFRQPPPPRVATHLDYQDRRGMRLDDVVLTCFAGPRSYTGEDAAEISCHGNPFIAQKILEDLFTRGCGPAEAGEFTRRAFLNGRLDLSQAEAVMDVIHARGERALAAAQDQLRGALGRRMGGLVNALLGVLARIEAQIDFPEEDLPPEDRAGLQRDLAQLSAETERLLATSHYGQLLRDGIKTVIAGEPNVGKSSLMNRLVGRNRALVSPEPGTTRDYIEERIMVGPYCLRLIDTAGLNTAPGGLEQLGIEHTHERLAEADLVLVVLDASRPNAVLPGPISSLLQQKISLIILNKSDLCDQNMRDISLGVDAVLVSALTGAGMDELVAAIAGKAETFRVDVGDEAIAVNARHAHALTEARQALDHARAKLESEDAVELIASDLRTVLAAYGEITGKVDNERMLDQLFASFCIGK